MFDRAIIDTDRFMDLSMTAKALYFLLGMEADDEGFVSYKKVMRIHGGNEDDMKILCAKQFLIHFDSGVVVITDWNTNNWLDTRRLRPTEYQKEKKLLALTVDKKYELSNGLERGEESSIEQKRIEEKKPLKHSLSYLSQIPDTDLKELVARFDASANSIKSKAEDLLNYCRSKGKVYKDYHAFLLNALKKDFKPRQIVVRHEEIKLTPEQVERNREMLSKVGDLIKKI